MLRAVARSPSITGARIATQIGMVLVRIDTMPAGMFFAARNRQAVDSPVITRPIATTPFHSSRVRGQSARLRRAMVSNSTAPISARAAATVSGGTARPATRMATVFIPQNDATEQNSTHTGIRCKKDSRPGSTSPGRKFMEWSLSGS
uniref:Unannotated protein n=1 Tax=freshwater metagenome TaxID=449393 RepID=A0A6J7ND78_9ZZZZ